MNIKNLFSNLSAYEVLLFILPLFFGAAAVCASIAMWSKLRTIARTFLCSGIVSGYGLLVISLFRGTGFLNIPLLFSPSGNIGAPVTFLTICFFTLSILSPLCIMLSCIFFIVEDSRG